LPTGFVPSSNVAFLLSIQNSCLLSAKVLKKNDTTNYIQYLLLCKSIFQDIVGLMKKKEYFCKK